MQKINVNSVQSKAQNQNENKVSDLAWGIIGAGNIAAAFVKGIQGSDTGRLVAVASRELSKARDFCTQNKADSAIAYGNYLDLLANEDVEAVYIALPHTEHLHWTVRALQAGKHVLCEKPIGLNHAEAMIAYAEAARTGKVLMEAFMYRCTPQTAKLIELLRSGIIGEVRQIQSSFCYSSTPRSGSRTWEPELAGGGILDVGCYPMSMARLIAGTFAGAATGTVAGSVTKTATDTTPKGFAEPIQLQAMGQIGATGVDDWAVATLRFPNNIVAQISTAINAEQEESLRIAGSKGALVLPNPWYGAGSDAGSSTIELYVDEALAQSWTIEATKGLYSYEVDHFADAVQRGAVTYPGMTEEDSLGNLAAMDQWRAAIGLQYPKETTKHIRGRINLAGMPLDKRRDAKMPYGQIRGLNKSISRLVMGVDNQETLAHGAAMFDDFIERGGNTFDTAHIYDFDGGHCEQIFGDWMHSRGIRDEITLISKGAHTPNCTPEGMRQEFSESLERLQTDASDIYILHRDNLQVPVGEFVDVLNQHVQAGKFKIFGGSNWSIERIAEANAYAAQHGLQGFSVVSNQLSLARMISPIWGGCVSAGEAAARASLKELDLALFAWSSQARGFFTDRAAPDRLADEELVRCWYSADNFERRQRAIALAKEKSVSPINIALAWVLGQNFPCFSLIGPRNLRETASSMHAIDLVLSTAEMAWLDLEIDTVDGFTGARP